MGCPHLLPQQVAEAFGTLVLARPRAGPAGRLPALLACCCACSRAGTSSWLPMNAGTTVPLLARLRSGSSPSQAYLGGR